jgi:hypothetical protein
VGDTSLRDTPVSQGDRAGVAMEMHHVLGLVNVVQQVLGRNAVDNRNFCRSGKGWGSTVNNYGEAGACNNERSKMKSVSLLLLQSLSHYNFGPTS